VDGIFAGNGVTLEPEVTVNEPVSGGGTITTMFGDFAFGEGVLKRDGKTGVFGCFFRRQSGNLSCPKIADCLSTQ
jgi:hypothetical protein